MIDVIATRSLSQLVYIWFAEKPQKPDLQARSWTVDGSQEIDGAAEWQYMLHTNFPKCRIAWPSYRIKSLE